MKDTVDPRLLLAFAPVHKRAFGTATGVACAVIMAGITAATVVLDRDRQLRLDLLAQYFTGYTVSWVGVLVGAAWGFFVGFVGGWFLAFARNLVLTTYVFFVRARAQLTTTRDFLDHI